MMEMKREVVNTYNVTIYLGGSEERAMAACGKFCDDMGLCVTVTPTTYIYTDGAEEGVAIGLINYGRFPQRCDQILETAEDLAIFLMMEMGQESVSIVGDDVTIWLSRRREDNPRPLLRIVRNNDEAAELAMELEEETV